MPKVPVTVYTTPNCIQCNQTKKLMDQLGIEYTVVDLSENPDLLDKFKAEGHLAAPIVTTDRKTWSGFRYDKIKSLATFLFGERKENA